MVSGHGDSWDIAEGAMDDGGGFISSWEAVRAMKVLGLKPKRTIRAIVWVNEENGDRGGLQYYNDQNAAKTLVNHSIAIETDIGSFYPIGLGVSCSNTSNGGCGLAIAQLEELSPLLEYVGGGLITNGGGGADIEPICETGIVCAGFNTLDPRLSDNSENNPCTADSQGVWSAPIYNINSNKQYDSGYFWFHHSEADTMERIDPTQLNRASASLAIWTYAIAQLPELLPRNNPAPLPKDNNEKNKILQILVLSALGLVVIIISISYLQYKYPKLLYSRRIRSISNKKLDEERNDTTKLYSPLTNIDDA